MQENTHLPALLAAAMLAVPMAAQAQYDIQQIDYPGAPQTQVFGVNDRGDLVGNGFDNVDSHPFVYAIRKGRFTDVAPAAGYADTSVLGTSDSGVLAGSVTSLDLLTSAFVRDKNGAFRFFSHPDAPTYTQARGVNNKGLVTGIRDTLAGPFAAFIYDPKTGTFADIAPSVQTFAHGINSKGEVVGDALFFPGFPVPDPCGSVGLEVYAWWRAKDGSVTYFQVNGQWTRARGINDKGFIVGSTIDPVTGVEKGFIVKRPASSCEPIGIDSADLLAFPGATQTIPEGVNNPGTIVGVFVESGIGDVHGFVATPQ